MKKLILPFLFGVVLNVNIYAQKKERRIYYLDCSYSMVEPNKIWDDVCNDLCKSIDGVNDPSTDLVVIPFAVDGKWHKELDVLYAKANEAGKTELKRKIKSLKPSRKSMTYHSETLNDLYESERVDENMVNYVFIMTDGKDEENPSKFPSLLKKWNDKYGNQHVYGFYVMLHKSAKNDIVSDIINKTAHFWEVSTANVNMNLVLPDSKVNFFVRGTEKYVDVPVSGDLSKLEYDVFGSSEHYSVAKAEYLKNSSVLRVYFKIPENLSMVPDFESCMVNICVKTQVVESASVYSLLLNDKIQVQCVNKKVKSINPTFK